MKAAIESAGLGLTTTLLPNGVIQLNDTPRFTIDTAAAPRLIKTGVPSVRTRSRSSKIQASLPMM